MMTSTMRLVTREGSEAEGSRQELESPFSEPFSHMFIPKTNTCTGDTTVDVGGNGAILPKGWPGLRQRLSTLTLQVLALPTKAVQLASMAGSWLAP